MPDDAVKRQHEIAQAFKVFIDALEDALSVDETTGELTLNEAALSGIDSSDDKYTILLQSLRETNSMIRTGDLEKDQIALVTPEEWYA